jgi:hypothetical protein
MIGRPVHSVLPSDWLDQSVLLARPCPCMPLDKTYPTGGRRRVFKPFTWLGVGSVKMASSRPGRAPGCWAIPPTSTPKGHNANRWAEGTRRN